jgi:5-methylcytosine-specific restriction endonuclease McrA
MAVYVLDKFQKPLMPCSEKRARKLLSSGRARVYRMRPFAIRLVDRTVEESKLQPIRLKIDPGSKGTGIALTRGDEIRQWVLALIELKHRGHQIRDALTQRRSFRRRRRGNLRYRPKRFDNRIRPEGWLAPSLQHRVDTVISWVGRLCAFVPVTAIDLELVRFDTQLMQNPDISGVEYQQGSLAGYEIREYLLEKWGRQCIYCDAVNVPLQIEHLHPKSDGGSNRPSNLGIACEPCNQRKGSRPLADFVQDPQRLARIQARMRTPLRDAAAVNAIRWALYQALKAHGVPVHTATGGRTKWNRSRLGIPKTHALDAACVGIVEEVVA